ncbi:MAG TPA: ATP-grasp domain-containing protein [Conexibacter sp.]
MPPPAARPSDPVLLVALSARMLADLATRAGHRVIALDRFGDLDLQGRCASVSILRDLGGRGGMAALVQAAAAIDAPSVVYGAGLENRPELVARLAEGRILLGNPPATLERVRDPHTLGRSLRSAGLAYPETLSPEHAGRADPRRDWLRKPALGGGGRGVRRWDGGALSAREIVQERVVGLPCSVAAVADGRDAVMLGLSEQLVGRTALGAAGFRWCGNVVPPRLRASERTRLLGTAATICEHVARAFGLRGLFGVDVVWNGRQAWVLEVNPRPTASLEAIEDVYGTSAFRAHVEACAGTLPEGSPGAAWPVGRAVAKGIVFAREDVRPGDTRAWLAEGIRDVPHPGEPIMRGQPICTVLASATTPDAALATLEHRGGELLAQCEAAAGAVA